MGAVTNIFSHPPTERSEGDICPQAVPKGRALLQPEPWSLRSMGRSALASLPGFLTLRLLCLADPGLPRTLDGHVDGRVEGGTGGLEERKATSKCPWGHRGQCDTTEGGRLTSQEGMEEMTRRLRDPKLPPPYSLLPGWTLWWPG